MSGENSLIVFVACAKVSISNRSVLSDQNSELFCKTFVLEKCLWI